jgi:hypothetical protein
LANSNVIPAKNGNLEVPKFTGFRLGKVATYIPEATRHVGMSLVVRRSR